MAKKQPRKRLTFSRGENTASVWTEVVSENPLQVRLVHEYQDFRPGYGWKAESRGVVYDVQVADGVINLTPQEK